MYEWIETAGGLQVPPQGVLVEGKYLGQLFRGGRLIDEWESPNLVVNEGLNGMNNIIFSNATQIPTWYLGVFEGNYTPVAGVTAATIAAAATETTAYAAATRPEYVDAASAAQVTTNAANRGSFVFNATKTIYGAFLVSTSTKGGTAGTLFSASRFTAAKNVVSGDELLLTYAFTSSSV